MKRLRFMRTNKFRIGFGIGYTRAISDWLIIDFCMWQVSIILNRY